MAWVTASAPDSKIYMALVVGIRFLDDDNIFLRIARILYLHHSPLALSGFQFRQCVRVTLKLWKKGRQSSISLITSRAETDTATHLHVRVYRAASPPATRLLPCRFEGVTTQSGSGAR